MRSRKIRAGDNNIKIWESSANRHLERPGKSSSNENETGLRKKLWEVSNILNEGKKANQGEGIANCSNKINKSV